jgi:protection-of-telomeres protein 1
MPLPSGFKPIKECKDNGVYYNVIGIVVLYQEPVKSGGSDWCLNFTLQDDFASGSVGDDSSITCRFFQATPDKFPKLSGVGDIIILRTFKLTAWRHRIDLIGDKYNAGMIVFPGNRIPIPELSQAFQAGSQKLPCDITARTKAPSPAEQMAVIQMKHASSGSEPQVQQHAATMTVKATTSKKRSLIKDLEFNRFYEIRAQVVNTYYHPTQPQVDLKVTDYTENKNLYYYGDPEKDEGWEVLNKQWKGPFGYLTINVTLFDANASWAQVNVAEGDFVYMRNVLIRMSPANKLEGRLHQDRQNPNQVDIRHLKQSSDIEEINERRAAYEKQRGSKTAFAALQNVPDKPSAKTSSDKRRARKERQRAEKEAVQQELEKKEREWETGRGGVNTNSEILRNSTGSYERQTNSHSSCCFP